MRNRASATPISVRSLPAKPCNFPVPEAGLEDDIEGPSHQDGDDLGLDQHVAAGGGGEQVLAGWEGNPEPTSRLSQYGIRFVCRNSGSLHRW